jgi:hypothetical protein
MRIKKYGIPQARPAAKNSHRALRDILPSLGAWKYVKNCPETGSKPVFVITNDGWKPDGFSGLILTWGNHQ